MRARAVLFVVLVAAAGCRNRGPTEGGAPGAKADRGRRAAEALALGAVDGAARAQARAVPGVAVRREAVWLNGRVALDRDTWRVSLRAPAPVAAREPDPKAAPKGPVRFARPGSPPVLAEHVCSLPFGTEAEAEADALEAATAALEQKFAALDPPVRRPLTPEVVRAEYLRADTRAVRPPPDEVRAALAGSAAPAELVCVEFDVEVTADQVRELRARERLTLLARAFAGLVGVLAVGALVLRARPPGS